MAGLSNGLAWTAPRGLNRHEGLSFEFTAGRYVSRTGAGPLVYRTAAERLTVTSSPKMVRNAAGLLVETPANAPAFEWNGAGQPLGLLIENVATNLTVDSADASSPAYTLASLLAFGSGSALDAAAAPDGTATADLLVPNTATGVHGGFQTPTLAAGTYTRSRFVKRPAGSAYYRLAMIDTPSGGSTLRATFDLNDGSIANVIGVTAVAERYADGWWRLAITYTLPSTAPVQQRDYFADAGGNHINAGDGTSGLLFWGAQLELGAAASSFIPTSGTAVVRAADTVTLTPLTGEANAAEGAAFVEFMPRALLSGDAGVLARGGGAAYALINGGAALRAADGTNLVTGATGTLTAGAVLRMAAQWGGAPNDLRAAARLDGVLSSATAPFDGAMGGGNLVLGDFSGQRLGGWLRRFDLWPVRQADSVMDGMV